MTRTLSEILVLIIIAASWWHFQPSNAPTNQYTPATQSKELQTVGKEVVQAKIELFKEGAKKKLKLDKLIQDDPNHAVVASSKVQTNDRPVTITTILEKETGKVTTLQRLEPYPLFAFENRKEISISHGLRGVETVSRITGTWSFAQVKGVHLGAIGSYDTGGQTYIGVSLAYRW